MFQSLTKQLHHKFQIATAPAPPPPPTLLLFGDSLTARSIAATYQSAPGWATLLRESFPHFDILVRGFSGYNSRWACHIFPKVLRPPSPVRIVLILLGTNDSVPMGSPQHVPIEEYSRNLKRLALHAKQHHAQPILLTPPSVEHNATDIQERSNDAVAMYANACVETELQLQIPVIDLFQALSSRMEVNCESLFTDGVHLSRLGNHAVFETVAHKLPLLCPMLADPQVLQSPFPLWSQVDHHNPVASLGVSELVDF